jgi:hypothetical protein
VRSALVRLLKSPFLSPLFPTYTPSPTHTHSHTLTLSLPPYSYLLSLPVQIEMDKGVEGDSEREEGEPFPGESATAAGDSDMHNDDGLQVCAGSLAFLPCFPACKLQLRPASSCTLKRDRAHSPPLRPFPG